MFELVRYECWVRLQVLIFIILFSEMEHFKDS